MPENAHKPGDGFLGWLGRQIGHVAKAVKTDVTAPSKTVYRDCRIEEKQLPHDPNVKLRRTIIDEVVVNQTPDSPPRRRDAEKKEN
jgi:hypothetical protein